MSDYSIAYQAVGGLSYPSKMPCASWSIPRKYCGVGSKLAASPSSVCHFCYAGKGTYQFATTRDAMARRWDILSHALADPEALRVWIDSFVTVLAHRCARTVSKLRRGKHIVAGSDNRFFRWHDSGDLQGLPHLLALVEIAHRVPQVEFWLPTKESGLIRSFLVNGGVFPSNLTVRISLPRVDMEIPPAYLKIRAMSDRVAFSAVHKDESPRGDICPAPTQEGACGDCRNCWQPEKISDYHLH